MKLSERFAQIPLFTPADHQTAGPTVESINMGLLHSVACILMFGAITGNDTAIKAYAGATDGTKTTALAFRYRLSGADHNAAGADQYGDLAAAVVAATGLVFADAANYSNRTIIIELDSDELPDGQPWLTLEIDDGSASVLLAAGHAIGVPKHQANDVPTVI